MITSLMENVMGFAEKQKARVPMPDYEKLARDIEGEEIPGSKDWNLGLSFAANMVRRAGRAAADAKVLEDSSIAAPLGACVVDLEQKIAQVEVRLGKRLADLERAGDLEEAARREASYWRGAAWMAATVSDTLNRCEFATIPVEDVRRVLKLVPKERR